MINLILIQNADFLGTSSAVQILRRCYWSASHWHRSVLSYFILGQYGY